MTEWYEKGYPGGPMVVPPTMFPRPLYPPDAAKQGKTPSSDGPDVLAYKRTLWRAGRWQGPASSFDRAFSNAFSHGKAGGNVGDSGVAGMQRQQKIDPTGWVGQKTFNTLASLRIPEGLPHAGEMAMDANAANLIAEAFQLYQKPPPATSDPTPPPTTKTSAQARLDYAIGQLGITESPANSNATKYGAWYGVNYQPWCAIFITYCDQHARPTKSFVQGSRWAYVPYVVSDARAGRNGLSVTNSPKPGDLVCFDWERDGTFDHIGIFESGSPSSFTAIEGNTSTSNNSNGGQVMRRNRSASSASIVFVRVAEP